MQVGFRKNPAQVKQRVLARQLDDDHQREKRDRRGQEHAQPPCFEPPVKPAKREHDRKTAKATREQKVAQNIRALDDFRARRRRNFQQVDQGERDQREAHFHRVEGIPAAYLQQRRRDDARERCRQQSSGERDAEAQREFPRRRKSLQNVEKAERRKRCRRHAAEKADDDRRMQICHEQVEA
ncbi:hypothetical protein D3C87_1294210 [compost metagenome]